MSRKEAEKKEQVQPQEAGITRNPNESGPQKPRSTECRGHKPRRPPQPTCSNSVAFLMVKNRSGVPVHVHDGTPSIPAARRRCSNGILKRPSQEANVSIFLLGQQPRLSFSHDLHVRGQADVEREKQLIVKHPSIHSVATPAISDLQCIEHHGVCNMSRVFTNRMNFFAMVS
jgi:hypothetical protein